MDKIRLKFIESFPKISPNISDEIGLMVIDDKPYFNCLEKINKKLELEDWYRWFYSHCQNENYHINKIKRTISNNSKLVFIPISIYKFDSLDIVLENIKQYPDFGIDLPYGHQTVLVKYDDKYYYYDPETPEYIDKLEELFGRIDVVGDNNIQTETNDNFCLLHTLNFIELVEKHPNELENKTILKRITRQNIDKQLYNIAKKLI